MSCNDRSTKNARAGWIVSAMLVITFLVSSHYIHNRWFSVDWDIRRGEHIVKAISKFLSERKTFPSSLRELASASYIDQGDIKAWEYAPPSGGDGFNLVFENWRGVLIHFSSTHGWSCSRDGGKSWKNFNRD